MSRFGMNRWMWLGSIALATVFTAPQAQAESPLCRAAEFYREAVRRFEREVLRCDVHRSHERLVDDLEDSTSRLRSAARNPERLDRLFRAFYETRLYHHQVERLFFVDGIYPPNARLEFYWDIVAQAYVVLEREMQRCGSPHGYRSNYPTFPPAQTCPPTPPTCGTNRFGSTRITIQTPRSLVAPAPALSPFSVGPALDPRSVRPQLSIPPAPSVTPFGLDALDSRLDTLGSRIERTPTATRQPVTPRQGYRMTLTGAMLQRLINER